MKKIAIIGPIHEDGKVFLNNKKFKYFEINNFEENFLIKKLKDVDGIILRTAKLSARVMQQCPKLKIVARHGVGYDNVDVNYLKENNISLAITGTSNAVSVAEHVMTMFLYLSKKINKSDELVKKGKFKQKKLLENFYELYQKNILILGFGRIGQAVAKRCLGFETNVFVYDPFVKKEYIEKKNCKKINFSKGVAIADFITIHIPITKKTKNLISRNEFKIMKKNCILINTARGGIINESELFRVLKNKKILGAGLDVFEKEPPNKNNPFFKLDNILLTPHNAALTLECRKRMSIECAENIFYFLKKNKKLNKKNILNL